MGKRNWIKVFNEVEAEAYEMTYEVGNVIEEILKTDYTEVSKLCEKTLIETKYNNKKFKSLDEKFRYIIMRFNEVAELNTNKKSIKDIGEKMGRKIDEYHYGVDMLLLSKIQECTNIEEKLFLKRRQLLLMRLAKQLDAYQKMFLHEILDSETELKTELMNYVFDFNSKYQNKKLDELRELETLTIDKFKYRKIFDYKDMCKHAKSNGFEHKRTTGDHMMFEHKKTKELIPIPAHELGYGLMREIQKEIKEKSAA
ncbi:MAG: type II toxin-antitoxin system HicA family toxin [Clostridium sp.]